MSTATGPDLYFSFFMFTADLRPDDAGYAQGIVRHMRALRDLGYAGFDLPIAPPATPTTEHNREVSSYAGLRAALDKAGLQDVDLPQVWWSPS